MSFPRRSLALSLAIMLSAPACAEESSTNWQTRQAPMVEAIRKHAETGEIPISDRTMEAVSSINRAEFVPDELKSRAWDDSPLPIGHGQTISQPYIVALMTELARVEPGDKVLEVGTGSGYQAAILGKLAGKVFTIEIVDPLAKQATARLKKLGLANVTVRSGDGHAGWPEEAPFDAIVVTAAPEKTPPPLIEQLKPGGRLVIPVGKGLQELVVMEKSATGRMTERAVLPVRFVPFTGTR
jgi:protein-L-isoaspartate(D-aspartate) O-methyltransferase